MFQSLINLPKQALFALINQKDKRVYISYTTRLPHKLGTIVTEMNDGTWRYKSMLWDRRDLELVILETTIQKNFVRYYRNKYKAEGYELYNEKEKTTLWYEFKINYSQRKVLVVAVNNRNDKTVLGRFVTYEEARGFLFYVKHNNPANSLVYSI